MPPKRKISAGFEETTLTTSTPKRKRVRSTPSEHPGSGHSVALPEKRLARFKPRCPQNILERVERVMSQRFFLVRRERDGDELREKFHILGSTGNVYEVIIDKIPSCTCPDAGKGNHCKHILFVFLKVLNVPIASPNYYQKALIADELRDIFAAAPVNPTVVASRMVRDAYAAATGSSVKDSSPKDAESSVMRKDLNGEDCAICYEAFRGSMAELERLLVWCDTCQNAVHQECFNQWSATSKRSGSKLTCVYCRTTWPEGSIAGPSKGTSEGYMNFAGLAGLSTERDTSSYHHGRPSWKRYGWY